MGLETEFLLLGWGLLGAVVANALFSERKRPEGREPVDFWRVMEVLGLWAAAGVGLSAIFVSARDAKDQLQAIRGQLDEMQQEGRPWIGPAGAAPVTKDRGEPLKASIFYRNFGRQPATFVRNSSTYSILAMEPAKQIEDLSGWKDPKVFDQSALCGITASYTTVYPGDLTLAIEAGASKDTQFRNSVGQQFSFQSILDAITQKRELYLVHGCFTYVAGGKREFTTFCVMFDPRVSNGTDLSTWKMTICPYGNDNGELPPPPP